MLTIVITMLAKWWFFYLPHFVHIYYWNSTERKSVLLLPHYVISLWSHGSLFYSMGYKLLLSLNILYIEFFKVFQLKTPSFNSYFFLHPPIVYHALPYFLFEAIFYFSCSRPGNQSLIQGNLITFTGQRYLEAMIWTLL